MQGKEKKYNPTPGKDIQIPCTCICTWSRNVKKKCCKKFKKGKQCKRCPKR